MQGMVLSDRQKNILQKTVFEYVKTAQPVSSQLLQEHFSISPATIRNEFHVLSDKGFLAQPHISSGRLPTDKGYRFFVDNIIDDIDEMALDVQERFLDPFVFLQILSKALAVSSSNLVVSYFPKEDVFLKEGWENLLQEPEFEEKGYVLGLTKFLRDVEENIREFQENEVMRVYIGKENPFSRIKDFSIILSPYMVGGELGLMGIIGPTRMAYEKNIGLMKSLMHQIP